MLAPFWPEMRLFIRETDVLVSRIRTFINEKGTMNMGGRWGLHPGWGFDPSRQCEIDIDAEDGGYLNWWMSHIRPAANLISDWHISMSRAIHSDDFKSLDRPSRALIIDGRRREEQKLNLIEKRMKEAAIHPESTWDLRMADLYNEPVIDLYLTDIFYKTVLYSENKIIRLEGCIRILRSLDDSARRRFIELCHKHQLTLEPLSGLEILEQIYDRLLAARLTARRLPADDAVGSHRSAKH